jgi:2-C-methyl-D-erythritol 4-phosphate cytidylyltransferase
MKADRPKQYLPLLDKTVIEHTIEKLLAHRLISMVIVPVSVSDPYFSHLSIADDPRVIRVAGGQERSDSVMNGLDYLLHHTKAEWALVHDAARPCFDLEDIDQLIDQALADPVGAILASPVRDTMKRSDGAQYIEHTVERAELWHALTPQMFRAEQLLKALQFAWESGTNVTDDASAMEFVGLAPKLVSGKASNIKITQPEDLALAEFYLRRYKES